MTAADGHAIWYGNIGCLWEQEVDNIQQDACRREVNRHKLDICVLRLRQGRIQAFSYVGQNFLVLKWGGGLD